MKPIAAIEGIISFKTSNHWTIVMVAADQINSSPPSIRSGQFLHLLFLLLGGLKNGFAEANQIG